MHTIAGISPNADARKCRARFVLTYGNPSSTQTFEDTAIISVNIISEYSENSASEPICELNVVLDNSNRLFNVTDKNNLYYSLSTRTTYGEIYVSSVCYGTSNIFLKKTKLQYDSISFQKNNVTLKFYDPFGFETLDGFGMAGVCNRSDGTPRAIVDDIMESHYFAARCEISDELNNARKLSASNFEKNNLTMSQRVGLKRIALLLSSATSQTVICYMDDNGNLKYAYQKNIADKTETLTETDYFDFRIEPPETKNGAVIGCFNDRGNILRELGDTICITQEAETFHMRIFRISYTYINGVLSAENKGYILT